MADTPRHSPPSEIWPSLTDGHVHLIANGSGILMPYNACFQASTPASATPSRPSDGNEHLGAACLNSVIDGGIRPNSDALPKLGDSRNVTSRSCCKRPLVARPPAKLPPLPLTPTQTTSRNTSAICIPLLFSLPCASLGLGELSVVCVLGSHT